MEKRPSVAWTEYKEEDWVESEWKMGGRIESLTYKEYGFY